MPWNWAWTPVGPPVFSIRASSLLLAPGRKNESCSTVKSWKTVHAADLRASSSPVGNPEWPGVTAARSPSNPHPVLRLQDLVVLLRLALEPGPAPTAAALGAELGLGLTASEVHAPVERAVASGLVIRDAHSFARMHPHM